MTWRVHIQGRFSAAHYLTREGVAIEPLHGHNYKVDLVIQSNASPDPSGVIVDFNVLESTLKIILDELDMHDLNKHPAFDGLSPSAENIARFIAESFLKKRQDLDGLLWVRVWEDANRSVSYRPPRRGTT